MEEMLGGIIGLGMFMIIPLLMIYPTWRCLRRAGYKPAWSLLTLIPVVGLFIWIGIFTVLAFSQWPAIYGRPTPSAWRAFVPSEWVTVSREEATQDRYYGLEGFLLAMYGLLLLGAVPSVVNLFSGYYVEAMQISYGILAQGAFFLTVIPLVWLIALLVLMPLRRPAVPFLVIAITWAYTIGFLMIVRIYNDPDVPNVLPGTEQLDVNYAAITQQYGILMVGVSALATTWYWLKSKRVNVTYRHRIPAAD